MKTDSFKLIVIAVLAIVGVGLTAATLDTMVSPEVSQGSQGGSPNPGADPVSPGTGNGSASDDDTNTTQLEPRTSAPLSDLCIKLLTETWVLAAGVIAIGLLIGLAYVRLGFVGGMVAVYAVGVPAFLVYALFTQCPSPDGASSAASPAQGVLEMVGGTTLTETPIPPAALAAVFALVALVALVMFVSATGSETVEPPEETLEEDEEPELTDFARVAGEAADRIEQHDADIDNEVYQAWWEMTRLLDMPNPDTSTPGEFAEAAIEVGFEKEDIDRLTTLFEEVRYGRMDPEPREELAVETLRNVEQAYGDHADADGEGGDGA